MKPSPVRTLGAWAAGTVLLAAMAQPAAAQSPDWQSVTPKTLGLLALAITFGAEERLPLYACRAQVGAGTHPGRFRADFNGCHIGFDGREISVAPFEVLIPAWQDAADGVIPQSSFVSGQRIISGPQQKFSLAPLYPCRTFYQGGIQVGEVASGDRGCRFGFGGRQVTEQKYQVLWDAPWMVWVAGIFHQIPPDAVVAGTEGGEPFYMCRAGDDQGLHPGKVRQSATGCSIVSNGKESVARQFAVLVPKFLSGNAGTIPVSALPEGVEKQEPIYLCRAQVKNSLQIGKITERLASCRVGMLGHETENQAYDILTAR